MPDSYGQLGEPSPFSQGDSTLNEGTSGNGRYQRLLTTPATVQEDSMNKMWSSYMKEAEEYDKRVTDVWRKDTSNVLNYVSLNTLRQRGYLIYNL